MAHWEHLLLETLLEADWAPSLGLMGTAIFGCSEVLGLTPEPVLVI
jgi:hypothetical protein